MALTPEDVVNQKFTITKFRDGYDLDQVDDFLDTIVEEFRASTKLRRLNCRPRLTSSPRSSKRPKPPARLLRLP